MNLSVLKCLTGHLAGDDGLTFEVFLEERRSSLGSHLTISHSRVPLLIGSLCDAELLLQQEEEVESHTSNEIDFLAKLSHVNFKRLRKSYSVRCLGKKDQKHW